MNKVWKRCGWLCLLLALGTMAGAPARAQSPGEPSLLSGGHPTYRRVEYITNRLLARFARWDMLYDLRVFDAPVLDARSRMDENGGLIVVTTGAVRLARTDAAIAWMLGHELAHINFRHSIIREQEEREFERKMRSVEQLPARNLKEAGLKWALRAALRAKFHKNQRNQERACDKMAVRWMSLLGYNPREAIPLAGYLGEDSHTFKKWKETHPGPKSRQEALRRIIARDRLVEVASRARGYRLAPRGGF